MNFRKTIAVIFSICAGVILGWWGGKLHVNDTVDGWAIPLYAAYMLGTITLAFLIVDSFLDSHD